MKSFREADFVALASLWNAQYPPRYAVASSLIRQNTVESAQFDWGASVILTDGPEVVGFIAIKRPPAPSLFSGPDPDAFHVCAIAHHTPMIGHQLIRHAYDVVRERGGSQLWFGRDLSHFWPGCPTEVLGLRSLLEIEGFEAREEVFDLERDLSDYEPLRLPPDGFSVRPLQTTDVSSLEGFLQAEFPGRWQHDVLDKVRREEKSECVVGLFQGDVLVGMALTQDESHQYPRNGAVWNQQLGPQWGALGPIGVAKSVRGQGAGDALLSGALATMRDRGVKRAIIDWTVLETFYGRHGFVPTNRYQTMVLTIQ
ncbi:MAG: GNAT family N-acetyltransferase [Fimbriimonas sp.]